MDTSANLSWAWPWVLLLLPLPWVIRRLQPQDWGQAHALRLPLAQFSVADQPPLTARRWGPWALWLLLLIALARPELDLGSIEVRQEQRQLMMALDLSGSMSELLDGLPRLEHAKRTLRAFITQRSGDQIGLLVFGGEAYVYVPLTDDHALLLAQLARLKVNLAGPGTAMGDAIALGVAQLQTHAEHASLILLSDGLNNAGLLTPAQALELASQAGITTHLVLMDLVADPDLEAQIQATGGQSFSALHADELEQIYQQLHQLEPVTPTRHYTQRQALLIWPLLAALLLAVWLRWRRG